ncbi:MAG TPA: tetratricopeptide repeat protein, partial [Myxococcaceae bacterium]|nr:tetratricopeptide repeat protein [Myxococcaceae bacterium]
MRFLRALTRVVPLLALVGQGAGAASRFPKAEERPRVDRSAISEALTAAAEDDGFSSPASYAHFLQARRLHLAGAHRGAVDELRLALATDDGNPHLLTRLGEEYARLGELRRAERELRRVVDRHPAYYAGRLMLGRVLMEAGKSARARLHLRRAIRLRPQEPEAYLVLAQLYLERRQPGLAVKVVEQLAKALPGEDSGYRRLGLALADRGDDTRAERLLKRAVERNPGDVEVWLTLARLQEKAGRLAEAEESLAQALEREPDNQEVLLDAGQLALRLGSSVRARAYFDRLLSLSEAPELAVRVAFAFLSARDIDSAARVLEAARKEREHSPRLSFYVGLVYERQRRFQEAAAAYEEVPVSSELFPDARTRRALCLSQAGEHVGALALLRQG